MADTLRLIASIEAELSVLRRTVSEAAEPRIVELEALIREIRAIIRPNG